ncbi:MAG TPA: 2-phosphosulfolactate phosphatase [Dehalococcoidia bacterium]|nr:2-phosphosulfolactate phosphatase [Dehalococcoidia bacterium]
MRVSVALTPAHLREPRAHAIAVVDVLRASTSLVTMFERGLLRAVIAANLRDARSLAVRNFSLLCGEVRSLPPAGFDFGNSPADLAVASFRGKSAVLMTTNGTRALHAASGAPVVAAAALRNRRAAAARLHAEASKRGLDIAVVCAGQDRGNAFSLEDTACAGAIVEALRDSDPALALGDDAWAALHLWRWYRGDAMRAFRQSAHGRALIALGFERDLRYAAGLDRSDVVPMLRNEDGVLTLRTQKPRR